MIEKKGMLKVDVYELQYLNPGTCNFQFTVSLGGKKKWFAIAEKIMKGFTISLFRTEYSILDL